MGITFSLKTRITFNGKEYGGAEEMPPEERKTYEQAMAALRDPARASGVVVRTHASARINVNGQEYDDVEQMPPDIRKTYEMAMEASGVNRKAAPALGAAGMAASSRSTTASAVRSPLNRGAAVPELQGQRPSRAILILVILAGIIAGAVWYLLSRGAG